MSALIDSLVALIAGLFIVLFYWHHTVDRVFFTEAADTSGRNCHAPSCPAVSPATEIRFLVKLVDLVQAIQSLKVTLLVIPRSGIIQQQQQQSLTEPDTMCFWQKEHLLQFACELIASV